MPSSNFIVEISQSTPEANNDHFEVEPPQCQLNLKCFIRSLVPRYADDAPDIPQEANLVIWQKRSEYEYRIHFKVELP